MCVFILLLFFSSLLSAQEVKIGVLFDFLSQRWLKDRDYLLKEAQKHSVKLIIKSAEQNQQLQIAQAKELIEQGVKALLVIPHHLQLAGRIVELAHQKGVFVIAYDRIIRGCDLDFYVSFDSEKVGELQAKYALKKVPQGNFGLVGGSPSDFNALLLRKGQLKILTPQVKAGRIKILFDFYTEEWKAEVAKRKFKSLLAGTSEPINAVLCGNDILAGAIIEVIESKGLQGKVFVAGQDAELSALHQILEGKQSITIYKPIKKEAHYAMELAVKLARGEKVNYLINRTVNNGFKEVPSILLEPLVIDKSNIQLIIKDGFYTKEQVFGKK